MTSKRAGLTGELYLRVICYIAFTRWSKHQANSEQTSSKRQAIGKQTSSYKSTCRACVF